MSPRDVDRADSAGDERAGPGGVIRGDAPAPSRESESARRGLSRTQRLAIYVGPWLLRLLALTWRVRATNEAAWRALHAKREGFIFSLWHGQLLPLLVQHRGQGVAILISEHRDGEVVARIAHALGMRTLRGSTSRGAARALLAMTRELEQGGEVAVTPDGPRGPAHTFAPGALVAANRAGTPIIAIGVHASRAWRLNSWDKFMIPKPFARLTIVYSPPTFVEAADARVASEQTPRFERLMHDAVAQAEQLGESGR